MQLSNRLEKTKKEKKNRKKEKQVRNTLLLSIFNMHCISVTLDLSGIQIKLRKNFRKEVVSKLVFTLFYLLILEIFRLYCNFFQSKKFNLKRHKG